MQRLFAILIAGGMLSPIASQGSEAISRGAAVYGTTCGRCHAPRSPLERGDREWVTISLHMRTRANLTGPQVRAVLAFLQGTNSEDVGTPSPGMSDETATQDAPLDRSPERIAAGRELTTARACIGCHVIAGTGGNVGPALAGVVSRRGVGFVRRKIAMPSFNNEATMMPRFGLSAEEIDAIVAYLETLGTPQ